MTPPSISAIEQLDPRPSAVVHLVARLVTPDDWPTLESERPLWFEQLGLPVSGTPVSELDRRSESRHFTASGPDGWGETSWRFFEGDFTGLSWFLWRDADEAATRTGAEALRRAFSNCWTGEEDPENEFGFACSWTPPGRMIEMYFHAPRTVRGVTGPGCVQLAVSHRERATVEDERARRRAEQELARWTAAGHPPIIERPPPDSGS